MLHVKGNQYIQQGASSMSDTKKGQQRYCCCPLIHIHSYNAQADADAMLFLHSLFQSQRKTLMLEGVYGRELGVQPSPLT